MKPTDILAFMRGEKYAVQASLSEGGPQAAVVGIVISDDFEIFFDTLDTTRKSRNLRRDARIAFVIGGGCAADERTVQCTGVADEPMGTDLARLKGIYFARFPDGVSRQAWAGITYLGSGRRGCDSAISATSRSPFWSSTAPNFGNYRDRSLCLRQSHKTP